MKPQIGRLVCVGIAAAICGAAAGAGVGWLSVFSLPFVLAYGFYCYMDGAQMMDESWRRIMKEEDAL